MTGPSSSHTAGAVRLGRLAASILGTDVSEVVMGLHGSFACTGKGHGTDRALISGLMGWTDDDPRIAQPFEYADAAGLRYSFETVDLGELAHPNSVRFSLAGKTGERCTVTGSSIGGGKVIVTGIDDIRLEITGDMPTLLTLHEDRPGVIAGVTRILAQREINVARMSVFRKKKGDVAAMVVETDQPLSPGDLERISGLEHMIKVRNVRR